MNWIASLTNWKRFFRCYTYQVYRFESACSCSCMFFCLSLSEKVPSVFQPVMSRALNRLVQRHRFIRCAQCRERVMYYVTWISSRGCKPISVLVWCIIIYRPQECGQRAKAGGRKRKETRSETKHFIFFSAVFFCQQCCNRHGFRKNYFLLCKNI